MCYEMFDRYFLLKRLPRPHMNTNRLKLFSRTWLFSQRYSIAKFEIPLSLYADMEFLHLQMCKLLSLGM